MDTALIHKLLEYRKFNKLQFFTPYHYQLKFMNAGKHYKQRYMRAGNRTGKTYGASFEMAMHLTGQYQPWFEGDKIEDAGHVFWCIGVDLDSVSKVMQKELFGTADCRITSLMGTGALPRDSIVMDDGMVKDGARIRSCFIQHVSGGMNTLMFYGSNNESTMMGQTVKGVWLDEEPTFNSMELYAQCLTRTATTDGFIMFTATPEAGYTELNRMYDEDESGQLYLQSVGWDDCPHITEEVKTKLLSGIPEWQHEMRMNGIPVLGTGAIFPIADSLITESTFVPMNHHQIVAGIDFGMVVDPSVITFYVRDDDGVIHGIKEIYLDEDRSPRAIANAIKSSEYPHVLTVVPHDAGLNSDDPQAKGKLLIEYGVNVYRQPFTNPVDVKLGTDEIKPRTGRSHNSIQAGLVEMLRRFEEGTLKVSDTMTNFLSEKRSYFWRKTGDGYKPTGPDHCIDSSRYAIMSMIGGISTTVSEAVRGNNDNWRRLQPKIRY